MRGVVSVVFSGNELAGVWCEMADADLGGSSGLSFRCADDRGELATVVEFESDASSLSVMEWSVLTPSTGWDMPKGLLPKSMERVARGYMPFFRSSLFLRTLRNWDTFLKNRPVRVCNAAAC